MKEQYAVRCGCIDVFLHASKTNSSSLQLPNAFDQVFQGAPESIQFPNDERVTSADELERRFDTVALSGRAAGNICEQFLAPSFFERVALQLEVLVLGANAGVTDEYGKSVLEDTCPKPIEGVISGWVLGRILL